jgi:hypothetical protein
VASTATTRLRTALALALVAGTAAFVAHAPPAHAGGLKTAFVQYPTTAFAGDQAPTGFALVRDAGGSVVKIAVDWATIAPARPADAADPKSPGYNWTDLDAIVQQAAASGVDPFLMLIRAPKWATVPGTAASGWAQPNLTEFALFAHAIATRYSGHFDASDDQYYQELLPRVRYWEIWNEPNLNFFLAPQHKGTKLVAASLYRSMVNKVGAELKAVDAHNVVVAGGTGPFKRTLNSAPIVFLRTLVCLDSRLKPVKGCGPVHFDVWGHHPYTSGGPTHKAAGRGDASMGDLPRIREVLNAAKRRGKIATSGPVGFWVDEFGWDSSPPDPKGVPSALLRRWIPESMYRMWTSGVGLVAWLQLSDNPWTGPCGDPYQSGFYFSAMDIRKARPKPTLEALRFPFVALRSGSRIVLWGRTTGSKAGTVTIERRTGGAWRRVGRMTAKSTGIFTSKWGVPWKTGYLRARFGKAVSVGFSLHVPPDRFVNPFGSIPPSGGCTKR